MPSKSQTDLSRHLNDDELMESYVLASEGGHLSACPECHARYDALTRVFEQIRTEAVNEADAVFTDARLHEQRDRILRRLGRLGHPADVLMFPNRIGSHASASRLLGPARNWVAGAAAAGLVAGLLLGLAVDRRVGSISADRGLKPSDAVAWQRASAEPALAQDEQILLEIEDLVTGPHRLVEMRVLDDMTTPPELQKEASVVLR